MRSIWLCSLRRTRIDLIFDWPNGFQSIWTCLFKHTKRTPFVKPRGFGQSEIQSIRCLPFFSLKVMELKCWLLVCTNTFLTVCVLNVPWNSSKSKRRLLHIRRRRQRRRCRRRFKSLNDKSRKILFQHLRSWGQLVQNLSKLMLHRRPLLCPTIVNSENNQYRGKDPCILGLQFYWIGILNPNQLNWRPTVQWYFPFSECSLVNYNSVILVTR